MYRRHLLLLGMLLAVALLLTAFLSYPGGSSVDPTTVGFDWKHNYLSNLFGERALNGAKNASRAWAIAGWCMLCITYAFFFIDFSKKIPSPGAAGVIRYCGVSAMVFAMLIVTRYHDLALTFTTTLGLLSMFYVVVYIFRSRLTLLKVFSVLCLLICYVDNYIYYSGSFIQILPVMQKINMVVVISWILCLYYFTKKEDFQLKEA
ncbi:MAG TPA: hypothetical protein VM802_15050 [Chitinophaga sp.]|uniref:hypothetical protein n=1 Tax=Chitinophaga sp. TaxID=1869181 RepID=UPI002C91B9A3|nr:hypothetical protein [Chitinophaga sp.]HVI46191.1 hypothetical protein [Chitinophaga sp.]